jgi:hypothetical protein
MGRFLAQGAGGARYARRELVRRILLGLTCVLGGAALALGATTARGQAPLPGALLGGGRLGPRYIDPHVDAHLTSLVTSADGTTVTFYGDWAARCPGLVEPMTASFVARDVPVAEDGSFAAAGEFSGEDFDGSYSVAGVFTEPRSATGSGRAVLTLHLGDQTITCTTPSVSWEARGGARLKGRAHPEPSGAYYGTTSETFPLVLRVSKSNRKLAQAALLWDAPCRALPDGVGGLAVSSPTAIGKDGRFTVTFTIVEEPAADQVAVTTATLRGTFGNGNVAGTFQATARVQSLVDGSLLDSCSTGPVSWAARL